MHVLGSDGGSALGFTGPTPLLRVHAAIRHGVHGVVAPEKQPAITTRHRFVLRESSYRNVNEINTPLTNETEKETDRKIA